MPDPSPAAPDPRQPDGATYEIVSRTATALARVLGESGESYAVVEPPAALQAAHEWLRQHPVPEERDYIATYREFWADIVETNGLLDFDKVARELHDAKVIADEASTVYDELAGLSKPNSAAHYVIQFAREQQAAHLGWVLRDLLTRHVDSTADEIRAELTEWAEESEDEGGDR